jgi:hypothetical protein
MEIDLDASRPNWVNELALDPGISAATTSPQGLLAAARRQARQNQKRIINDSGQPSSRPLDFLKLVRLTVAAWEDVSQQTPPLCLNCGIPLPMTPERALGRGLSYDVVCLKIDTKLALDLNADFVACKKLRGLNDGLSIAEKSGLLQAVLLEVRVLRHPPLRRHPNIIRLLELYWETDADLLDHAWPVIALEYAENGTLANFQDDHPQIPFALKK